jgi:hypothetical protein
MREHRADEMVDGRHAKQVGGQRPGQRVVLEQDEIRFQFVSTGEHIVDHVSGRDLPEKAGIEVVVDPLGCQTIPPDRLGFGHIRQP